MNRTFLRPSLWPVSVSVIATITEGMNLGILSDYTASEEVTRKVSWSLSEMYSMIRKVYGGCLRSFSFSVLPSDCPNPRPIRRTRIRRTRTFYVFWPSSTPPGRSPPARRHLTSDTWTPHPRSRSTADIYYYLLLAPTMHKN